MLGLLLPLGLLELGGVEFERGGERVGGSVSDLQQESTAMVGDRLHQQGLRLTVCMCGGACVCVASGELNIDCVCSEAMAGRTEWAAPGNLGLDAPDGPHDEGDRRHHISRGGEVLSVHDHDHHDHHMHTNRMSSTTTTSDCVTSRVNYVQGSFQKSNGFAYIAPGGHGLYYVHGRVDYVDLWHVRADMV